MRFSTSDTFPTNTSNAQPQQEWRNHASPHHAVSDILRPLLCFNLGYIQYGIPSCVPMMVNDHQEQELAPHWTCMVRFE
jgi:hypothetical protein